jgi:hypothetical protein
MGAGGDTLATVVGSCAGGRCGSTAGAAADVWMAGVLIVAGTTETGRAVEVGIAADIAGVIAVDTGAGGGVESLGVTISSARWDGCSSNTTVAAATAIVARTTPVRTIRLDHRLSSRGSSGVRGATSSPLPADSSASSGSNR